MAYDLVIKNGTVVDGTGAPRVRADVAIKDGTIAEIGKVSGGGQRTIDAGELIVAPGFVDPHTHYDAQICWDPLLTCTSWHGVTSVVMGNCGVGIAPCKPEVHEIAAWDLVNVEAIPFDALSKGITWDWESFPEFMDAAAAPRRRNQPRLPRAAHAVSPLRDGRGIDGAGGVARTRPSESRRCCTRRWRRARWAFPPPRSRSTSAFAASRWPAGSPAATSSRPTPTCSRNSARARSKSRSRAAPARCSTTSINCSISCSTESARPVTWLAMASRPDKPEYAEETLKRLEPLIKRGGVPQVLCKPFVVQIDLRNPFSFADMDAWNHVFNQPPEAQKTDLRRPGLSRFVPQGADAAASVQRQMESRRSARSRQAQRSNRWSAEPSATSQPNAAVTRSTPSSTSRWRTTSTSSTRWRSITRRESDG